MWLLRCLDIWRAYRRLRDYEPNNGRLTLRRVRNWVNQFPKTSRDDVARLAANLEYFSRNWIVRNLETLNAQIAARLSEDGIQASNIVYVALDDPASSSPAMCKLLRDQGGLSGAKFVAATSGLEITKVTSRLGTGAIVYVDDFSGTGQQFITARQDVRENIAGTFSEFFLLPCICEEALTKVEDQDVVAMYHRRHTKVERPLLSEGAFLDKAARARLVKHSENTWGIGCLGFEMLATNVVFSHAAPDTTPIMFRGDRGQYPWFGIVPRWAEIEDV